MKHYKKTGPKPNVSLLTEYKNKKQSNNSVRIANTPFLVILESPSKCKKIETYLGFQYKCIASNGHIRGLTKINRLKDGFEPVFDILPEKAAHVSYMRADTAVGVLQPLPGGRWHYIRVCILLYMCPHATIYAS